MGFERLAALPPATLAMQLVAQGVLSGVVATWAFSFSVAVLGTARALLFPGLLPVSIVLAATQGSPKRQFRPAIGLHGASTLRQDCNPRGAAAAWAAVGAFLDQVGPT